MFSQHALHVYLDCFVVCVILMVPTALLLALVVGVPRVSKPCGRQHRHKFGQE